MWELLIHYPKWEEYWIPQGRIQVKNLISKCLVCQRHERPSFRLPNMPPWPRERVSRCDPFQFIGLDYLGPLFMKQGAELKKAWVCLFTCVTVRAIHLDWVLDLTAIQLLSCLRRFVSRRSRPVFIYQVMTIIMMILIFIYMKTR